MYQDKTLQSVFVETISKTQKNTIVEFIYKHPKLSISDFTNTFLQPLLDKLSYENKNIILLGDFNIDLLHYESHSQTRDILDCMYPGPLSPQIIISTTITPCPSTLIDNIFKNTVNESLGTGNLTFFSDHLAQFLIYPELTINNKEKKKSRYKRNYKKLSITKFKEDSENLNWIEILKTQKCNRATSLENLLQVINILLDRHSPLKELTKREIKTKSKP